MRCLDTTQEYLVDFLKNTEGAINNLLSQKQFDGYCKITPNIDLGFPHDVVRVAGGFATGMYIEWHSAIPFIPIDICMNVCTVSIYSLDTDDHSFFKQDLIQNLLKRLNNSTYIPNFHRGNHFITLVRSLMSNKLFIIIHSDTAEFERDYNGLYPVEGNYFYNHIKNMLSLIRDISAIWMKKMQIYLFELQKHYQDSMKTDTILL